MNAREIQCIKTIPIVLALAWLGLLPMAQAVSPAPDGGYIGNNTAEGTSALLGLTNGVNNTALGFEALKADTSGGNNTATGARALWSNVADLYNTADGAFALLHNTASYNTATGYQALYTNTAGANNTANGAYALQSNTASENTATGYTALSSNTTGFQNAAVGSGALRNNTTGANNTATGYQALYSNKSGTNNTAIGVRALKSNTTGNGNIAIGPAALSQNATGSNNIAIGSSALSTWTGSDAISIGDVFFSANQELTIGKDNTDTSMKGSFILIGTTPYLDCFKGTLSGSQTSSIGLQASEISIGVYNTSSDPCALGALDFSTQSVSINAEKSVYVGAVYGNAIAGETVAVNNSGQLGVTASSARFKEQVRPMGKASDCVFALRPVSFRYKKELDPKAIPQFGLIAEEVEKVNADLVSRDRNGKAFAVRYEAVNAMLLNEFLKEHRNVENQNRKIQEQETTIAELKSAVAQQKKEMKAFVANLKEQAAQIQKVSAQVEMIRPAPQMVLNNQ